MYPLVRIDKRIPDGSIWQARRSYLLSPHDGWMRVYGPTGTEWSNPLGGWKTQTPGVSLFHVAQPFTISCHGPAHDKRFYIDIAHRVRVEGDVITFTDLYLDVMIDATGVVTEKDEHQLRLLAPSLADFARAARDDIRARIASADPLFDAGSSFYDVPPDALRLPPATGSLAI